MKLPLCLSPLSEKILNKPYYKSMPFVNNRCCNDLPPQRILLFVNLSILKRKVIDIPVGYGLFSITKRG